MQLLQGREHVYEPCEQSESGPADIAKRRLIGKLPLQRGVGLLTLGHVRELLEDVDKDFVELVLLDQSKGKLATDAHGRVIGLEPRPPRDDDEQTSRYQPLCWRSDR